MQSPVVLNGLQAQVITFVNMVNIQEVDVCC
jgi:hypothetical protein